MPTQQFAKRLPIAVGVLMLKGVYWFPIRGWFRSWGKTPDEVARTTPGDALIADPTHTETSGVTVNTPPGDIWPWLVQIGYQRGGLCEITVIASAHGAASRRRMPHCRTENDIARAEGADEQPRTWRPSNRRPRVVNRHSARTERQPAAAVARILASSRGLNVVQLHPTRASGGVGECTNGTAPSTG